MESWFSFHERQRDATFVEDVAVYQRSNLVYFWMSQRSRISVYKPSHPLTLFPSRYHLDCTPTSYTPLKMFAHTVFQTSINQPTPTLPSVRRKNTLLGLKVKNTRKEELSTKNALDVNVRARRPAPIITRAQFVLVEEAEREVAAVSADRVQRQMAISLDCLEGRRPENLETSSDWDTLLFLEDIGEMKTAVPVVRSAFSVYVARFKNFVDEL